MHTQNIEEVKSLTTPETTNICNQTPIPYSTTSSQDMASYSSSNSLHSSQSSQVIPPYSNNSDCSSARSDQNADAPSVTCISLGEHKHGLKHDPSSDLVQKHTRSDGQTLYPDDDNEAILKNLMVAQEAMLEDLDVFLDEIKLERRKKDFIVSTCTCISLVCSPKGEAYSRFFVRPSITLPCLANNFKTTFAI